MTADFEFDIKNSPIGQFFHGRSVFITGVTGLVGKLFSLIQKQLPSFVEKIVVVDGDIGKSDLGISKEDRKALEENIYVVFHSAARAKFREHLRVAVQQNVLGTQHVMNLCRKMTQLTIAKGFRRTVYCKPQAKLNVVPSDIVVNTLISTAYHTATERFSKLLIVNCTFDENKMPKIFEEVIPSILELRDKYPLSRIFRYPNLTMYKSKPLYWIHSIIDHFIPAALIDIFLFIFTGKTELVRLHLNIERFFADATEVFSKIWEFQTDNYHKIMKKMSEKDSKIFFMDLKDFDWDEYIEISSLGGRRYLAKEDPSTIPYAKKKQKIWWFVTTTMKWCLISGLLYYLTSDVISNFLLATV